MFTGIIRIVGHAYLNGSELTVKFPVPKDIKIGDSVCINGVCLTVIEYTTDECKFFLMQETLNRTTFPRLTNGEQVNIELALSNTDKYDGHIVQGHVNEVGTVTTIDEHDDSSKTLTISPLKYNAGIKFKNSITINGVSLTISKVQDNNFSVSLIPFTLNNTTFQYLQVGDTVNLEYAIDMSLPNDTYFMQCAVNEAEKGRLTAPPNPWVGCVIVYQNNIIGTGYHRKAGDKHAEVNAIENVIASGMEHVLEYSTLYTTLEPCVWFEHKRTPACTNLLIKYNIQRIVIGILDPHANVEGKGVECLKQHGCEVTVMNSPEVRDCLRSYIYFAKTGKPYTIAKIALSIDGCYCMQDGTSKWITGEEARKHAHELRAQSQAIMVGANTVRKDNPSLTVRLEDLPNDYNPPMRVCIAEHDLRSDLHIFDGTVKTLLFTSYDVKYPNVEVYKVSKNLNYIFDVLGRQGVIQCMVEGGNDLQSTLLRQNMVQEVHVYLGNIIFGHKGKKWGDIFNETIDGCDRYTMRSVEKLGDDVCIKYILNTKTSAIETAIESLKKGNPVIIMDDEDREDEGDLVIGAEFVTPEMVTFFKEHTTGILCVPMEIDRASRLKLPLLKKQNEDINQTPFAISCDAKECRTGVSSRERAITVQKLAHTNTTSDQLSRPGHIFPLIASRAGVLQRQGHTEASIEMCKLAGIEPVAMIGELVNKDGDMMRFAECKAFAEHHKLSLVLMKDLINYVKKQPGIRAVSSCDIELEGVGKWELICYRSGDDFHPHKVLIKGDIYEGRPVLTRVHSECFTGDVLGSCLCDCGKQLKTSLSMIAETGAGAVILPARHEGRGIGLTEKIRAYRLIQSLKVDTYAANRMLGFEDDERDYKCVMEIFRDLKISKINLITNNPRKIDALGSIIHQVVPLTIEPNEHNANYMKSKREYEKTMLQQKIENTNVSLKHGGNGIDKHVNIAIISTYWNSEYLEPHRQHIMDNLYKLTDKITIEHITVPGSFEIPFVASKLSAADYDAIICLGVIVKGDTAHFEYISSAVIDGLMKLQSTGKIPIINGILNTYTKEQAIERLAIESGQAESIALSAIKMIALAQK